MGEPKNHHFYDFGIWGRVQTPQNQLLSSLETPGYLKFRRTPQTFFTILFLQISNFGKSNISEFRTRCHLEETGTDKS